MNIVDSKPLPFLLSLFCFVFSFSLFLFLLSFSLLCLLHLCPFSFMTILCPILFLARYIVACQAKVVAFMEEHVLPAEKIFLEQQAAAASRWTVPPVMEELKTKAKAQGLWNLFLPAVSGLSQVPKSVSGISMQLKFFAIIPLV